MKLSNLSLIILIAVVPMLSGIHTLSAQATPSATRTLSTASISPGGQVSVTITVNSEHLTRIAETLPLGFTYLPGLGSPPPLEEPTEPDGRNTLVFFTLGGSGIITYTVVAPAQGGGDHHFDGSLRTIFDPANSYPVGGDNTVSVSEPPGGTNPPATSTSECVRTGSVPASRPELARDCEVLLSMKEQLEGSAVLNWYLGTEIGRWDHITVSNGRVVGLSFSYRKRLNGSIPPEIGELDALTNISFEDSGMTGPIPPEVGKLSNLRSAWFSHAHFTGSIPPELGNLTWIRHLRLNNNHLSGTIPPELANALNMEALELRGNNLTGCIPESLRALRELDVANPRDFPNDVMPWCDGNSQPTPSPSIAQQIEDMRTQIEELKARLDAILSAFEGMLTQLQ